MDRKKTEQENCNDTHSVINRRRQTEFHPETGRYYGTEYKKLKKLDENRNGICSDEPNKECSSKKCHPATQDGLTISAGVGERNPAKFPKMKCGGDAKKPRAPYSQGPRVSIAFIQSSLE